MFMFRGRGGRGGRARSSNKSTSTNEAMFLALAHPLAEPHAAIPSLLASRVDFRLVCNKYVR